MARKLKFEEVAEDVAITESPAESDQGDEDVAVANEIAASLAQDLQETEAQMESRFEQLESRIQLQAEQIKELRSLVRQFGEATQVLNRNYKSLAGEKTVSEKVSRSRTPVLEEVEPMQASYAHPAPRYQMEAPSHVTERKSGVKQTGDTWTDNASRQMARSRAVRGQAGGR